MKTIATIVCTIGILLGIWAGASWFDIVADNCDPDPIHSQYNLFVLMTENRG